MEENQVNPVVTEQSTGNDVPAQQASTGTEAATQQAEKTYTSEQVTKFIKDRLDRYERSVFKKYGVNDAAGLDSLFEKSKGYDDILRERDEALEKVAFMGNNINPDKYDDIRTYFKGKGLQFTEDALKQHLETHPEWVMKAAISKPKTTIKPLGSEQQSQNPVGEKEIAERMFGMTF